MLSAITRSQLLVFDRGVDITVDPSAKPYGIDFGIRDPFGNMIRIGQMFDPVAS